MSDSQSCIVVAPAYVEFDTWVDKELETQTADTVVSAMVVKRLIRENLAPKIIAKFNTCSDISGLENLYDSSGPTGSGFSPIHFFLRLPAASQRIAREFDSERSSTQKSTQLFHVVYDGSLMLMAASTVIGDVVSAFPDVRDRIASVLQEVSKELKFVPPSPTHTRVIVKQGAKDEIVGNGSELTVTLQKETGETDLLRMLYLTLKKDMTFLYYYAKSHRDAEEHFQELENNEIEMLELMRNFHKLTVWHIISRRQTVKKMQGKYLDILSTAVEFRSDIRDLMNSREYIRTATPNSRVMGLLLNLSDWQEELQFKPPSSEEAFRISEHAHREIELERTLGNSTRAAMIGGLAGAAITLILTNLTSIINLFSQIKI